MKLFKWPVDLASLVKFLCWHALIFAVIFFSFYWMQDFKPLIPIFAAIACGVIVINHWLCEISTELQIQRRERHNREVHRKCAEAAEAIERQRNAVKTNKTLEREIRADLEAERWRRQRNANLPSPEDTLRNLEVNINETD